MSRPISQQRDASPRGSPLSTVRFLRSEPAVHTRLVAVERDWLAMPGRTAAMAACSAALPQGPPRFEIADIVRPYTTSTQAASTTRGRWSRCSRSGASGLPSGEPRAASGRGIRHEDEPLVSLSASALEIASVRTTALWFGVWLAASACTRGVDAGRIEVDQDGVYGGGPAGHPSQTARIRGDPGGGRSEGALGGAPAGRGREGQRDPAPHRVGERGQDPCA